MASSTLNSATIGMQNATRDDGLTVVFNASYIHDQMAVQFAAIPEWIRLYPTEGVIPEAQNQDVDVLLDAAGLEDGIHEGTIQIHSNDPYNPLVEVPVILNVSLIEPTLTDFLPKVLRLADTSILRVRMRVELPAGYDPHDIRLSSVMFNDVVPALVDPPPYYTDDNRNGIEEVTFWFDWDLAKQTLAEGMLIPVTIMFEVEDVQWFRGTDYIRTGDPDQYMPFPGAYYLAGQAVPIQWNESSTEMAHRYTVQLSRDGGANWETLATQLTATTFDWTAAGPATTNAIVRVLSYDTFGTLLGSDDTAAPFTIAGGVLAPPLPIDGAQLLVERAGGRDGPELEAAGRRPRSRAGRPLPRLPRHRPAEPGRGRAGLHERATARRRERPYRASSTTASSRRTLQGTLAERSRPKAPGPVTLRGSPAPGRFRHPVDESLGEPDRAHHAEQPHHGVRPDQRLDVHRERDARRLRSRVARVRADQRERQNRQRDQRAEGDRKVRHGDRS